MKIIIKVMVFMCLSVFSINVFADANKIDSHHEGKWVNVPLDDTSPYDLDCQYRFLYSERPVMFYGVSVNPTNLLGVSYFENTEVPSQWHVLSKNKAIMILLNNGESRTINKMEKLCY